VGHGSLQVTFHHTLPLGLETQNGGDGDIRMWTPLNRYHNITRR